MMKLTNKYGLPQPVVTALTRSEYSRGESNRSITQLIDAPRVRILKQEHQEELTEDVSEKLWAVLGTGVHKMFENTADENHISEERLFIEVDGWVVSGAIDLQKIEEDGVIVSDYKTTSVWSVIFGKVEWEYQLNCYAALVRRSKGLKVKSLKVIAMMRDWKASEAEFKQDYPKAPILEIDIPLWADHEQDAYLNGRVHIHQTAEFSRLTGCELPDCTDAERWAKDPSWAVIKKGNKKATKVFDKPEEAHAFATQQGDAFEVIFRAGVSTRCAANWCRVNEWCSQYQKSIENS
jgi:hypothetical protein